MKTLCDETYSLYHTELVLLYGRLVNFESSFVPSASSCHLVLLLGLITTNEDCFPVWSESTRKELRVLVEEERSTARNFVGFSLLSKPD